MEYAIGNMVVHIHWVIDKPTLSGWEDIRQTVSGHTFYYIYSGKGIFTCEGTEVEVEEGTLVYLWPGLPLHMKSSETHPLRMRMILFDCASLLKNEDQWSTPTPIERLRLPFLLPLQSQHASKIGELFHAIERAWIPGDLIREARVKSVWYRLLQEIHEASEAGERQYGEEGISVALRKFKEKLDTGFANELRITELAQQTGFSPVYLRRVFAARYGCSPKEYLDQLRNEHAIRRLRFSGDAVTDIARACGYTDVYQFSKTFKKHNGLSPTEYRRVQGE